MLSGGRRHCRACNRRRKARAKPPFADIIDALWVEGPLSELRPDLGHCHLWIGSIHAEGYGVYSDVLAHRIVYELTLGPIPAGLTLDHLCRVRPCVNPRHLEPVTLAVNVLRGESLPARNARKTHCPKGHPYDASNTYVNPRTGWRLCRACRRR